MTGSSTAAAELSTLLLDQGWAHTPDVGEDGVHRLHAPRRTPRARFLARAEDETVYPPLVGGRGSWPGDSFGDEEGEVCGVRARVVGRASPVEDKSGPRADPTSAAKDRADVGLLTAALDPVQQGARGSIVRPGGT